MELYAFLQARIGFDQNKSSSALSGWKSERVILRQTGEVPSAWFLMSSLTTREGVMLVTTLALDGGVCGTDFLLASLILANHLVGDKIEVMQARAMIDLSQGSGTRMHLMYL